MNYHKLKEYLDSPPAKTVKVDILNLSDDPCALPFNFLIANLDRSLIRYFDEHPYFLELHRLTVEYVGDRFKEVRPSWYRSTSVGAIELAYLLCEHLGDLPVTEIGVRRTPEEILAGFKLWWAFIRYRMAFILY